MEATQNCVSCGTEWKPNRTGWSFYCEKCMKAVLLENARLKAELQGMKDAVRLVLERK